MVSFYYPFSVPINEHIFFTHWCSILGFLTYMHNINNNAGALDGVKILKTIFFPLLFINKKRSKYFTFLCTMRATPRLKLHCRTNCRSDSALLFPLVASSSLF